MSRMERPWISDWTLRRTPRAARLSRVGGTSYILIRKFDHPQSFTHVAFDQPVDARRFDVDAAGDYYFLGLEGVL